MKKRKSLIKMTLAALFLALAYVLPFLTGQIAEIGSMLCPMHLPVLICGFVCGWPWGLAVGFIAPLLRSLTLGMPPLFPTAISMALELAAYGVTAGLIPCADGGTSLAQWAPGGLLYDHAVAMARLAMRTSHLVGILWHQGEGDCAPVPSPTFSTRLTALIESLRRDLGAPEIPFIIGALGDFLADRTESPNLAYYPAINARMEEVASTVPNCAFVPAHGLTANEDNLHFNAASLHAFGLRYFDAFTPLHRPELYTEEHGTDGVRTAMEAL